MTDYYAGLSSWVITSANSIIVVTKSSYETDTITASFDTSPTVQTDSNISVAFTGSTIFSVAKSAYWIDSSLTLSWNQAVSLLINKTLSSWQYASTLLKLGQPLIVSERSDSLPVVTYSRDATLPIIVYQREPGIEHSINKTARIRTVNNQTKTEQKDTISANSVYNLITVAQDYVQSDTNLTIAWSYSVA